MTDLVAPLRAAALTAMRGALAQKVYDEVPSNRVYPYAALGPTQFIPETGEAFQQIDVWSLRLDLTETGPMADAIKTLFDRRGCEPADLVIPGFAVTLQEVDSIDQSVDHDALRSRARISLRVVADATSIESEA